MNALVINCSPVKNGATALIVSTISDKISERFQTKSI